MTSFEAFYYDGQSARTAKVRVEFNGQCLTIPELQKSYKFNECEVVPPLARTRRAVNLPDGGKIETDDLAGFHELELLGNHGLRLVNLLEQYWGAVLVCMAGLILFVWAFSIYGLPVIAKAAARVIPIQVTEAISEQSLKLMDRQFFEPSGLDSATETIFEELNSEIGLNCRLEIRSSPLLGANAFALPSGIIVMTDELIKLAQSDAEIMGVLAHEMGHIHHKHSIRGVIQNSGIFFLLAMLAGDLTSITSMAATLPTLLVETGYSREFEREADQFAANYLISHGWGTAPFISMLKRLDDDEVEIPSFLSTHPATEERIKLLEALTQP